MRDFGSHWGHEEDDEYPEPITYNVQDEFDKASKDSAGIDYVLTETYNKLANRNYDETIIRRITKSTIKYLCSENVDNLSYIIAEYIDNGYEPLGQIIKGSYYSITMIRRNTIKEL